MRGRTAWLLMVLVAVALPGGGMALQTQGPVAPQLLPLPEPDLSRLDAAIARQIEGLEDLVRSLERQGAVGELANAYGALGHLYVYYNLPDAAQACYENSRRLARGDYRWPYYLGFVAADLGEAERAIELFTEALGLQPGDLATLVRLGNLELGLDRTEAAAGRFRQAVELDPGLAAGWYGLGQVAVLAGDDAEAVRHLERARELQADATPISYALGQAYRRLGEIDKAREALSHRGSAKVRFPDPLVDRLSDTSVISSVDLVRSLAADRTGFPDLRFLSYTLSILSTVEGAVEHLEGLLANWPEARREADRVQRARLHYILGGLLVHHGRGQDAIGQYRLALELLPELDDARVKLANELARERSFEEAAEEISRVLERDPGNSAARLKRAAALMALGRWDPAAQDLLRLEQTDAENHEVEFRLAVCLERLGRLDDALPRYLSAGRLDPRGERAARAHFQAALLLLRKGAGEEALGQLQRATELDPGFLDAQLNLAGLLIRAGRYEAALVPFERALSAHPEAHRAHVGRATALLLLARYREAAEKLEASLVALPGDGALGLLLARVLAAAPDDAVHDGDRALELARGLEAAQPSPRTAEAVALAAAETGRFDEAVEWQRKAAERARAAGQTRLAEYLESRIPGYEASRPWRARGPEELIVLPGGG